MAATLVTLFPLIYFFPAVRGRIILCPDDGLIFNVPLRVAAARMALDGHVPLWNPYIFSGMPLLGSAQGGLLFPLNWFYLIFSAPVATNMMVVSTYMLAALGAYLYARRSGASVTGAAVTSLAWQAGGFLVAQLSHINIVQAGAMLPWVLWALDGYGAGLGRKWGVLLALFVALQAFAGHQQTLCYSILLASAYTIVMAFTEGRSRRCYLRALVFIGGGLLLAAVQILPTYELLRNSTRDTATYDFFTSFSMQRRFVLTLLAPYLFGGGDGRLFRAPYIGPPFYAEYVAYAGMLTLMLALVAVLLKPKARTLFWAATALVCLVLALGGNAPFHIYRLIYHIPVLNLFRVPARHLLEVNFALAVLAGRGLTALGRARRAGRAWLRAGAVGFAVLVLTCLAVTWLRPTEFRLGRAAPVSFLRAPEFFVPVAVAAMSAWALWVYARARGSNRASAVLLLVLAFDLAVWGQSSGWRVNAGPPPGHEYWGEPETVKLLREHERQDQTPYRILTAPHTFDPSRPPIPPSVSHSTDWVLWTQPDIYMMHEVENAAGYDGFGVARYSRLAGEIKVWGELTDPDATLRGDGRELDLLNVRYLLSMRPNPEARTKPEPPTAFPAATREFGGFMFAESDLKIPNLGPGKRLSFSLPAVDADRVALVTNLAWSEDVPDETVVAHLRLYASDGRVLEFPLRAGAETAEWSYDRPDVSARIRHKRAAVATSYEVADASVSYEAHSYLSSFTFPTKVKVTGGEITVEQFAEWPKLSLSVQRVSLLDAGKAYPLRDEWVQVGEEAREERPALQEEQGEDRWRWVARTAWVDIYENRRWLPRAWLASNERALSEPEQLEVIRTGRLPGAGPWEPLQTALVESETGVRSNASVTTGSAEVTRHEPNLIAVKTRAAAPALLILSENHYPGWRAKVDGRQVEILRVNYNLRGVVLPAGEHTVEFVYRPKSVLVGLVISLLTLALLILWWTRVTKKMLRR